MKRPLLGVTATIVSLAAAPTAVAAPPAVAAPAAIAKAKLPRAFVTLEARMAQLHVNSERGRVVMAVRGPFFDGHGLLGLMGGRSAHGKAIRRKSPPRRRHGRPTRRASTLIPIDTRQTLPYLTADFEASASPKLVVVRGVLLGSIGFQVREIGEATYTHLSFPLLTLLDRGKTWLYESPAEKAAARAKARRKASAENSPLEQAGLSGDTGTGLVNPHKLVERASSVTEIGPRTVDGRHTTEFKVLLPARTPHGKSTSKLSKKAHAHAMITVDLFLAPDGLPVRTRILMRAHKVGIDETEDILATEIPLSVAPPPASETISEAELKNVDRKATPK